MPVAKRVGRRLKRDKENRKKYRYPNLCKCGHLRNIHDHGECWGRPHGRGYYCCCSGFVKITKEPKGEEK